MIDSHCHLNFNAFRDDWRAVADRAFNNGVEAIVNVGCDLESSNKAIEIAVESQNCYASVGLHPIYVGKEKFDYEKYYLKLAEDKNAVAVGEVGLDYYRNSQNTDQQKEIFGHFLQIAREVKKPLIIHCRDAYEDLYSLLSAEKNIPAGVIHCFVGDFKTAKRFIDSGFFIGFTGIITFPKAEDLRKVVVELPLEKILIETDAPYLTPETFRGQRNEPLFVREVAKEIARIKKIPHEEIEKITAQNAKKLFGLKK